MENEEERWGETLILWILTEKRGILTMENLGTWSVVVEIGEILGKEWESNLETIVDIDNLKEEEDQNLDWVL